VKVYTAEKLTKLVSAETKRNAKRAAKAEAERALAAAEYVAWLAQPSVREALAIMEKARPSEDAFLLDLLGRERILTENQLAAGIKCSERWLARQAERDNAPDCPVGRVHIAGEILSIKTVESNWGNVYKMLVKTDAGYKVFGSVPDVGGPVRKGDRVVFDATVEPSHDDPKFGFYKRPTKAYKLYQPGEVVQVWENGELVDRVAGPDGRLEAVNMAAAGQSAEAA
jgi:hypothetical protein